MSEENVEVVRHWFERLAAGDPAPEFCDHGIEIRNWAEMPTPGPYHGHEGLHEWWTDVNDADVATSIQLFELVDALAVDDERVVTIQRARGKTRYSEIEVDFHWAAVIRVRNGKVISAFGYPTPADAKAAAGLAE
jgi:ketosteroid isomerase-like protein